VKPTDVEIEDLDIEGVVDRCDGYELWRRPNGFYVSGPKHKNVPLKGAWRTAEAIKLFRASLPKLIDKFLGHELWRVGSDFHINGPTELQIQANTAEEAIARFHEALDPATKTKQLPTFGRF
jgi:hypothetical protein